MAQDGSKPLSSKQILRNDKTSHLFSSFRVFVIEISYEAGALPAWQPGREIRR
jgi:hypothetical protein